VVGGGWVGSYPLSSLAPTPVEVELGCDNNCQPYSTRDGYIYICKPTLTETS
jgi:hypothetical protein